MKVLGIDIGGSGIKAAPVDVATGQLLEERERILTPSPATPEKVGNAAKELVEHFKWSGPIGIGFPGIISNQTIRTAANVDKSWIGCDGKKFFSELTGCSVRLINDADAAGLAEMKFGAGIGQRGGVLMLTAGTGIGSALFHNGHLFPNTEFGHIELHNKIAEKYAAASIRKTENLSWKAWGGRLNEYLQKMERLLAPDVIIVGGGISSKFEKFRPYLHPIATILPASLLNNAGIVGAALAFAFHSEE